MSEAGWDPDLALVLLTQLQTDPPAKTRRRSPHVDRHVEHGAAHHAHKLALRLPQLVMQTAQYAARGSRMVILNEGDVHAGTRAEHFLVVALEKEATRVAKHPGLQQQHLRKRGRRDL